MSTSTERLVTEPVASSFPSMGVYLGPATVKAAGGKRALLTLPDQEVWACLALAIAYAPQVGDRVLTISQDGRWYVIGVLQGTGVTSITAPGDLELRAPHGDIKLVASDAVQLKTHRIDFVTDTLNTVATSVTERVQRMRVRVAETYSMSANRLKAVAETTMRLSGRRILQRAKEDVRIDGGQIRLG